MLVPEITDMPKAKMQQRKRGLLSMVSEYALIARHHMKKYRTMVEQLARVSGKNHIHDTHNPYSQHQRKLSLEEVLRARMIADHYCVSIAEICHYEHLGLFAKGEGGRLIGEGITTIGGSMPVNTSGGLLAGGDSTGATGGARVIINVLQLTDEAGERQVPNAKIGLAHNLSGQVCSVQTLK